MREQYPYIDNPFGFVLPKKNPINKSLIKDWEDLSIEDKEILSEIKNELTRYLGEYPLYLYGSRVKGNWTEDSDYDIIIEKELSIEEFENIKKLRYPVKVDFKAYEKVKESIKEVVLIK
jgi:predicted nucleotidyltransferase